MQFTSSSAGLGNGMALRKPAGRALLSVLSHAYFYVTALLGSLFIGLVRLICLPFDKQGAVAHALTRRLAWHYVGLNKGWEVAFDGLHHLEAQATFVIVANHQSLLDVLVLARLNAFYKWIAKKAIFRMMGVAQLMRINQYIPVAHGDMTSVRRMMRLARMWIRQGVSVVIFPEGERSLSGDLLEFKDGPFRLACSTDTPVLPVVLCGTYDILPRGSWLINFKGRVCVKLLPPVHPRSFAYDAKALNAAVRRMIAQELAQMRQMHGARQAPDNRSAVWVDAKTV